MEDNFWLNDPKSLFCDFTIIPNSEMTNNERLNTLTRLLLVLSVSLYLLDYKNYLMIFILGLLLIIILNCNQTESFSEKEIVIPSNEGELNKPCWFDENNSLINAKYEITPNIQFNHDDSSKRSYMNAKYELTPLTDTDGFKEIWRNEPGNCGGYTMIPEVDLQEEPEEQLNQCNYIVRSKIDHLGLRQESNDLISMRPQAEASYNKAVMDFRNDIMNNHIDRFRRERQHNCSDMKLSTAGAGAGGNI